MKALVGMQWLCQVALVGVILMVAHGAHAEVSAPSDEPITPIHAASAEDPRRSALGAELFDDKRLSGDGRRSCESCHDIRTNGASGAAQDRTPDGHSLAFNTPTVFNAALSFRLNWEGNVKTLQQQAMDALLCDKIMGALPKAVLAALQADPAMVGRFRDAYGHGPDWPSLVDAIVTFERTLVTPGSRFDLWLEGDRNALTPEEMAGYQLFKTAGCISCHQGVNVGGNLREPVGIVDGRYWSGPKTLRVPSLRNVAVTAPYFDDGRATKLADAVRAMASGQLGLDLTPGEINSIDLFLGTLTGRYAGRPPVQPR